ncbi:uncharacterized protein Eint_010760 [Encephalitozoon intestinalis ATCC 50506]|uniref:histone acetyltransferase n=1 Tax=Encephalitozoon intestinalis (strain ATCC 50506) TaxID=876142 RepID=E0S5F3_ENCIT|nr:uncharacterized protein Eint_010760 [Encephalitozoon intestinalis ATCC 50506]ADM10938.1 hypothetical protein Eint_010760 [Encephalitozoon intestinalis ATCC 50506]UTX44573.1 histone acetyltransferase [Encephalitozoon intestinalis]
MNLEIKKHMKSLCGESSLGVQAFMVDERYLCLLFNREVLLAGVSLQKIGDRVYIKNIDTTGYERGHTKRFIISVLKALSPKISCCFSTPKREYIFNGSSSNKEKRILSPGNLLEYWVGIFENLYSNVYVWSNHYENISYPFKSMDEVVCFEDDPKEKLKKHFKGGLKEMFTALLCRPDFTNGSLVYGQSWKNGRAGEVEATVGDVGEMEAMLRSLDFSTISKARKSTKEFICRFGLSIEYFQAQRTLEPKKHEHAYTVLKPIKKV